jgi:hypothetical protein
MRLMLFIIFLIFDTAGIIFFTALLIIATNWLLAHDIQEEPDDIEYR